MNEQHEMEAPARGLRRRLKLAQERLSDLSWELEEQELRMQTLQAQLQAQDAPDTLLARELDELRRWRSQQEEQILQQMLSIDELRAQIGEAEHAGHLGKPQGEGHA